MVEKIIKMNRGISGRNASDIVFSMNILNSFIYFEKDGRCVNAKSILGLLSLDVQAGDDIKIIANGTDETEEKSDISKVLKLFE